MTRGRKPVEAIRLATRIAEQRGEVQYFRHGPGMICMFVIYMPGCVAHVRVKRIRHLHCTALWLEREAADDLAALRFIASSPGLSRELWLCSPRGNFRFFRVRDDSLVEIDRDGRPLTAKPPVKKRKRMAAQTPAPGPEGLPLLLPPDGIPEISVGEETSQDHTIGGTP